MANSLASRATFLEDAIAEFKGGRGYKRMIALYSLAFVLLKVVPHATTLFSSSEWIGLFSYRTWIIIALILVLMAVIDGGQRLLEKRTPKLNRPRLEGGIYDVRFNDSRAIDRAYGIRESREEEQKQKDLSPLPAGIGTLPNSGDYDDVIGAHITIRIHFVNEAPTETPIRNFRLEITTNNGDFAAEYPEDGEILQSGFGQRPESAKRFTNLIELIETGDTATSGRHIEGHLHFIVIDLVLRETSWIDPRVLVIDAWGEAHPLPYKLSKYSVPPPSERLLIVPPTRI